MKNSTARLFASAFAAMVLMASVQAAGLRGGVFLGRELKTTEAAAKATTAATSFKLPKISTPDLTIPKIEVNTPKIGLPQPNMYRLFISMKLLEYMLGNLKFPKFDLPSKIAVNIPDIKPSLPGAASPLTSLLKLKAAVATINDLGKASGKDIMPKLDLPKVQLQKDYVGAHPAAGSVNSVINAILPNSGKLGL